MVTKTKIDWTLEDLATDEVIDAYCQGLGGKDGDAAIKEGNIAVSEWRRMTADYCKREAHVYKILGEPLPKLDEIASTAVTYFEGLKSGICYVLGEMRKARGS